MEQNLKSLKVDTTQVSLLRDVARETEAVVENDVQRNLRCALKRLGPDGEGWSNCAASGPKHCTWLALWSVIQPQKADMNIYADLMARALGTPVPFGLQPIFDWNDAPERTFDDVRALYLRAIELAATP